MSYGVSGLNFGREIQEKLISIMKFSNGGEPDV